MAVLGHLDGQTELEQSQDLLPLHDSVSCVLLLPSYDFRAPFSLWGSNGCAPVAGSKRGEGGGGTGSKGGRNTPSPLLHKDYLQLLFGEGHYGLKKERKKNWV